MRLLFWRRSSQLTHREETGTFQATRLGHKWIEVRRTWQVTRLRRHCRPQLELLGNLCTWATRCELWCDDRDDRGAYFVLSLRRPDGVDHLSVYESGELSLARVTRRGDATTYCMVEGADPQLWLWLRAVPPQMLARAALEAARDRGILRVPILY